MLKEAIGIGETEEEALIDACKILGVDTTDVDFEVLQRSEKKVLGLFGGGKAKVRAFIESSPTDTAEVFLKEILRQLGFKDLTVEKKEEEGAVIFDLSGDEVGSLIGKRGETLDAVQYLTSLAANKKDNPYVKITLNVGEFRKKREKTLESLGRSLAIKTSKTGRKNKLEPMNPYERRLIHTAVQEIRGAISWSEGEGINRHVVIGPDPEFKRSYNRDSRDSRGGFNRGGSGGYNNRKPYGDRQNSGNRDSRGGYNNNYRKPNDAYKGSSEEKADRKPLNEGGEIGLYGRIDKD